MSEIECLVMYAGSLVPVRKIVYILMGGFQMKMTQILLQVAISVILVTPSQQPRCDLKSSH